MSTRRDHIVVVAHSLAVGSALVEQALSVAPDPGRKHSHMGTHNLPLSLGTTFYLGAIAIDTDADGAMRPRRFGLDRFAPQTIARLAVSVASSDDIASDAVLESGAGKAMRREERSWRMTTTADGRTPLSCAAPLVIQRAGGPHPASLLPDRGSRLRELRIRDPKPSRLSALLAQIALGATPLRHVAGR
jgi:Glyoxalase-like domain